MAFGVPEMLVFTQAGFYAMKEISFATNDGNVRPAREFRLTLKGYEAMARPGTHCFEFLCTAHLSCIQ